jgi:secondary thiamine-phosphate synthase enzyme
MEGSGKIEASTPTRMRFELQTSGRTEWVEMTAEVTEQMRKHGCFEGTLMIYLPHTTAGVTINENADPMVQVDMTMFFDQLVPQRSDFTHGEGDSDAHIKASLIGSSVQLIVREGRPWLGRWQGIFFCEFDGPRQREVWLSFEPSRGTFVAQDSEAKR